VFVGEEISVKLMLKNPLLAEMSLNKIRLAYKLDDSDKTYPGVTIEALTMRSL
jgi:hypothetical protein